MSVYSRDIGRLWILKLRCLNSRFEGSVFGASRSQVLSSGLRDKFPDVSARPKP